MTALSGDFLFVVFTAKSLRTNKHFHQLSVVHNTLFPACVQAAFNVLYYCHSPVCVFYFFIFLKLYTTPLYPMGHSCVSVRPDCHFQVVAHLHYSFT